MYLQKAPPLMIAPQEDSVLLVALVCQVVAKTTVVPYLMASVHVKTEVVHPRLIQVFVKSQILKKTLRNQMVAIVPNFVEELRVIVLI